MSTRYKMQDNTKLYFISYAVIDWIDVFIRNEYRDIIIKSFEYCSEEKGQEIWAYCIMTSHVHIIAGTHKNPLQDIIRDMKAFTSSSLRNAIETNPIESRKEWMLERMYNTGIQNPHNRDFQLWQQENHPVLLHTNEMLFQRRDYTHYNPVKAGFVKQPEDWPYSSASNYCGIDSVFKNVYLM